MSEIIWRRFRSHSDNPKSAIQNRNWAGLFAIVLALAVCAARVEAQQTGKIFRIGLLDNGNASGTAVLLEVFRQARMDWDTRGG